MKIVIDGTVVEIPKQSGIPGEDGKSAYDIAVENGFEGTVDEWLESLVGPQGEQGNVGPQGLQGIQGPQGEKGDTGDQGIQGPQGSKGDKGDKGDQGIQGPKGDTGLTGSQGPKGDTGLTGPQGPTGKTAYQYAVDGGYTGTENEFKALMGTGPWLPLGGGNVTGNIFLTGNIFPYGGVIFRNPYGGDSLYLDTHGDNNEPVLSPIFQGNSARVQVATPIEPGDAVNKGYVHDHFPIPLPIEKGGTGAQEGSEALKNLALDYTSLATYSSTIDSYIPMFNASVGMVRIKISEISKTINNRNSSITVSNTSYTTYMARGIALVTAVPTSMNNGTIVFTY